MAKLGELSIRKIAAAVGVLAILAGGAYYYLMYLPQTESASTVVAHQAVKSPAGTKPVKSPVVPKPQPASAVPAIPDSSAVSSVAAAPAQPAIATSGEVAVTAAATPLEAVVEPTPEPVKPKSAVKRSAPKKSKVKMPPVQAAKADKEPDVPATNRQLTSPLPAVLPDSGVADEPAAVTKKIGTPKYNDMLTAVLRSDQVAVRQLLDMGRWVDKPGSSGLTPLMAAVMNEDAKMVQLLLEHGAEPSAEALKLARKNKDAASVLLLEQHGAR